ncbi:MAG: hypothetical protein JSS53_05055 [Proteobacteria bacterium]|nr:hypothetical protein [Pseudomonadota bacterium]
MGNSLTMLRECIEKTLFSGVRKVDTPCWRLVMKNSIKKVTALLFSLCLGSLASVAHASWYADYNLTDNQVLQSGDYICSPGSVNSTDLSEFIIANGSRHQGSRIVCVDKHNAAWVWTDVGYEEHCDSHFRYGGHAHRCENQ